MTTAPAPTQPARRGRPGYDREGLIHQCVLVFNRHGYDATSMGMLAKELGISKSAIYHHVESKDEILDSALNEALNALEDSFDTAEATPGTGRDRLAAFIDGTVRTLVAKMPAVTLLLRLRGNSEVEMNALERRRGLTRRMAAAVDAAQQDGSIRNDLPAAVVARLISGMINSLVEWYRAEKSQGVDYTVEVVSKTIFEGL